MSDRTAEFILLQLNLTSSPHPQYFNRRTRETKQYLNSKMNKQINKKRRARSHSRRERPAHNSTSRDVAYHAIINVVAKTDDALHRATCTNRPELHQEVITGYHDMLSELNSLLLNNLLRSYTNSPWQSPLNKKIYEDFHA